MLEKDRTAFFHSGDDRVEAVVGQHHVGRLLGDVGAGDAHRDADVGRLQRWRVADAAPVTPPPRPDAGDPSRCAVCLLIHAHGTRDGPERVTASASSDMPRKLGPGDGAPFRGDAQFMRDHGGGRRMIAGDRDRTDRRRACGAGHRLFASSRGDRDRPNHQSGKDEVALEALSIAVKRSIGRKRPEGHPERAHRTPGEVVVDLGDFLSSRVVQRLSSVADELRCSE